MVRPNLPKGLCVLCKGARNLCGKERCPIILKQQALIPMKKIDFSTNELFGSSPPAFFVGRFSYPKVLVGPMLPPVIGKGEEIQILDCPELWYGKSIEELVGYRTKLVRSAFRVNVHDVGNNKISKILDQSQELAMATQPVDTEVKFEKMPKFRIVFDNHSQPMGPIGHVNELRVTENPKVDNKIEKVVQDTDFKASAAIGYLYEEKLPITSIIRVLSAGLLGLKKKRKLVPTRWAITAADDIASNHLISKIKEFAEIDKYFLFSATYLDNKFSILLMPKEWSFEQLETWSGRSAFNPHSEPVIVADYEFYKGRKDYASHVTGAYYSARLAIAEYLFKIRRQAAAVVFREVSGGYIVPLGVWVIRETVRDAFSKPPTSFETFELALKSMGKNFRTPLKAWLKKSVVLSKAFKQRTLFNYIKHKSKA
ncbi:MAG: Nre family DNA repair protein [Candidatus Helarchaeota archaeon]